MNEWNGPSAIVVAYLIGCIATAYYLVRFKTGQDIRQVGSGNVGGRNAGRVLGKYGFAIVAIIDALKGVVAVLIAKYLGVDGWMLSLVLIAVVAGHIWPVQLGFKGGKGAATIIGALLGYNYQIALLVAGMFVVFFAISRSFTIAGLLALLLTPLVLFVSGQSLLTVATVAALVIIVLFAHRANIRERFQSRANAAQATRH